MKKYASIAIALISFSLFTRFTPVVAILTPPASYDNAKSMKLEYNRIRVDISKQRQTLVEQSITLKEVLPALKKPITR